MATLPIPPYSSTLSPTVIKCKRNNNNSETLVAIWSRNLLKYVIIHWPQLAGDFYQDHYYFIRAIKALTDDLCRAHTAVRVLTVLKCLCLKYLTGVIRFSHHRRSCKPRIRRNLNIWLSLLSWRATAASALGSLVRRWLPLAPAGISNTALSSLRSGVWGALTDFIFVGCPPV